MNSCVLQCLKFCFERGVDKEGETNGGLNYTFSLYVKDNFKNSS